MKAAKALANLHRRPFPGKDLRGSPWYLQPLAMNLESDMDHGKLN
jgi:hypothetical protein